MEDYKNFKNEAQKFFDSLTKEDFAELLESVGFEVLDAQDGEGGIIYTDELKESKKHGK